MDLIAEIVIHEDEECNFPKLVKKLNDHGFKLNSNFPDYMVPVKGTIIHRERNNHHITFTQKKA